MKHKTIIGGRIAILVILALAAALGGCRAPAPVAPTPTVPDPAVVFTAAAQTAEARRQEIAAQTPTLAPATATATLAPEATAVITATLETPAATTAPAVDPAGNAAEFVLDVTVPDGTNFAPGASFTKTWRVKNTGAHTWTTAYALVFSSGEKMGAPDSVPLPVSVAPGQSVDISVSMTAPTKADIYYSFWVLRDNVGNVFGVGPDGNQPIYAQINVVTGATPGAPVATSQPTGAANTVSSAVLSVDNAAGNVCPFTFTFTGEFTLTQPASVTYELEAGTDQAGYTIDLPAPTTANRNTGTHTVVYTLTFSNGFNGWARLHITAPNNVFSNQVNFNLTCPYP